MAARLFNIYIAKDTMKALSLQHNTKNIAALVATGDRSWECVPTPCPGLEAAMLPV